MTDSPFLDPNDPHYEDTPSVDEHPLEGGGLDAAVIAALHELDGTQHFITHDYDHDGDDLEGVECITGPDGHREDAAHLLDNLRADGYLLVSEAELAEAREVIRSFLRTVDGHAPGYAGDHKVWTLQFNERQVERARKAAATLAKQQEDRER